MRCISGKTFKPKEKHKKETLMDQDKNLISRLYREAQNKGDQLSIFSQMYNKNKHEIAKFLRDECNYDDSTIRYWINR